MRHKSAALNEKCVGGWRPSTSSLRFIYNTVRSCSVTLPGGREGERHLAVVTTSQRHAVLFAAAGSGKCTDLLTLIVIFHSRSMRVHATMTCPFDPSHVPTFEEPPHVSPSCLRLASTAPPGASSAYTSLSLAFSSAADKAAGRQPNATSNDEDEEPPPL